MYNLSNTISSELKSALGKIDPGANYMSPRGQGKFHLLVKSLQTLGEIFARWKNAISWGKFGKEEFLQAEICTALTLKAACYKHTIINMF